MIDTEILRNKDENIHINKTEVTSGISNTKWTYELHDDDFRVATLSKLCLIFTEATNGSFKSL